MTRDDVLGAGRRAFLREERIDLVAITKELGIARATVYRWFGDRNAFTSMVLASLAVDTLARAVAGQREPGPAAVADALTDTLEAILGHPGMKAFLTRDPRYALTALTGPGSAVTAQLTHRLRDLIEAWCPAPPGAELDSEDLAYALVRLAEAFCYADITTGRPSEVARARPLFVRLLRG